MFNFENSVLYISLRSPFARRVRLAFREHNIKYEEKTIDVFNPPPDFHKVNPIARIPVLILKTGERIVDSNLILKGLYDTFSKSHLKPKTEHGEVVSLNWSGIGVGLLETVVAYYLETQRKKELQDETVLNEYKNIFKNVLEQFEEFIGDKVFIADDCLTQADLDMGSALAYFGLRYSSKWPEKYTRTAHYFARLNGRPSFQETVPPPV